METKLFFGFSGTTVFFSSVNIDFHFLTTARCIFLLRVGKPTLLQVVLQVSFF